MQSLARVELVEEDDQELVCFIDQMNNSLTLPLDNFVPKYEERELGRKLSTIVLTETSSSLIRMLNELFQKQALYHNLQNELVESSAFWIRNYSSIAMQVSSSEATPIHAKRQKPQNNTASKKSKGVARSEELNNRWSLEKLAESAWNGFCYLNIDDIAVDGTPQIRPNLELIEHLHLQNKSPISKLMILQKIKNIYKTENNNRVIDRKSTNIGLPDLYLSIKKGSKKFKRVLQKKKKT